MFRVICIAAATLTGAFHFAATAAAQALTAEMFARDPAITSATLSPDGRYVAMIQTVEGSEALVIVDWRERRAQAIQTARRDRGLFLDWVAWKTDNRLLFAMHQRANWDGTIEDDSWEMLRRVFSVNRDGTGMTQMFEGQMRRLASADYAPMHLIDILRSDPENVLFGTWGQNGYTIYRTSVNTGRAGVVDDDSGWDTYRMFVDGAGNPVMRVDALPYGAGYQYYRRAPEGGRWTLAHEVRRATVADNRDFNPIAAGPAAGQVYIAARPEGQEYQAVYLYNTRTGELGEPVYSYPNADAGVLRLDPNDRSMLAGCGETERLQCQARDPRMQRHFDAIAVYFEGLADFSIGSVSLDKKVWLILASGPTVPSTAYIYDLEATQITPIGSAYPQLPRAGLAPTEIVRYAARDGTQLWGYLTAPQGGQGPRPLVVMPHGGPEARDSYGYHYRAQFLASRGYAVFQPNFRGSEGSGRSFAVAGYRQWGLRMQDDVTDGVRHLIESGAADPQRICIVGASYGGYVALAGGAFTPELYRCVVSIAGVSDLIQVLDEERRLEGRGSVGYAYWVRAIGDPGRDRDALAAASPARHAENFRVPVLLIHGVDDSVVRIEQSETMQQALRRAGKSVEFVRVENEGHLWFEEENRQRMLEAVERFLASHLGGPAQ